MYTCDLGWDILWALLWGGNFIVIVFNSYRSSEGVAFASIAFSLAIFLLYATTAAISWKVRRAAAAARDRGDVEDGAVHHVGCVPVDAVKSASRDIAAEPIVSAKV